MCLTRFLWFEGKITTCCIEKMTWYDVRDHNLGKFVLTQKYNHSSLVGNISRHFVAKIGPVGIAVFQKSISHAWILHNCAVLHENVCENLLNLLGSRAKVTRNCMNGYIYVIFNWPPIVHPFQANENSSFKNVYNCQKSLNWLSRSTERSQEMKLGLIYMSIHQIKQEFSKEGSFWIGRKKVQWSIISQMELHSWEKRSSQIAGICCSLFSLYGTMMAHKSEQKSMLVLSGSLIVKLHISPHMGDWNEAEIREHHSSNVASFYCHCGVCDTTVLLTISHHRWSFTIDHCA